MNLRADARLKERSVAPYPEGRVGRHIAAQGDVHRARPAGRSVSAGAVAATEVRAVPSPRW
jgi:hypothetical protein